MMVKNLQYMKDYIDHFTQDSLNVSQNKCINGLNVK
jgi:hypothetical protein